MRLHTTRWIPVVAGLGAVLMLLLAARAAAVARPVVHRIVVDGPISPATADYIAAAVESADDDGATALLIRLDTPGGLLNSTKTIVKTILAAPIPVIVYVAPSGSSATSAGVFVTMAAHVAAMAPGTTIGAAHPVSGGGENIGGDMRAKVENYAAAFVGSIAEKRGRNVDWAEKAVRESVSITETEALDLNVIDIVSNDEGALLSEIDGREVDLNGERARLSFTTADGRPAEIVDIPMTFRQRVLSVVADPNIAYLLMMAGILGLYMEFSNPGTIFPGVVGVICLLLALLAAQVLPVSSTGVLLLVVGFAFLVAEAFLPSFGILGFGGIAAITLGSLFLYTPDSNLFVDRTLVAVTVVVFAVIATAIVFTLLRDRRKRPTTGAEALVGGRGVAISPVHRSGKIRIHGEIWNAVSKTPIDSGRSVTVVRVDGLNLTVEPCQEDEQ
jgi:membrane-bound serine protease (ClpP class)